MRMFYQVGDGDVDGDDHGNDDEDGVDADGAYCLIYVALWL